MDLPSRHAGIAYNEVLAHLSAQRRVKRYLEIGVQTGMTFAGITAETAFGIDPEFVLSFNIAARKTRINMFNMTSDRFFSDIDVVAELGGNPDLCFLDGMHLFEYLLRDFYNAERISSRDTLICMHDCLPLGEAMVNRDLETANRLGAQSAFPTWWTGDVWKIIPILQKYRPDLRLVMTDAPPTGLVFVTNLDPTNTVLRDNYLDIVYEFAMLGNDMQALQAHYRSNSVVSTHDILAGMNHSLFFRT